MKLKNIIPLIILITIIGCSKKPFVDDLNQFEPEEVHYFQTIYADSSPALNLEYWVKNTRCEDQFRKIEEIFFIATNISDSTFDSLTITIQLFTDSAQTLEKALISKNFRFEPLNSDSNTGCKLLLKQESDLTNQIKMEPPFWNAFAVVHKAIPIPIHVPDTATGEFSGEIRFYSKDDLTSPIKFTRVNATISEAGDVSIYFLDMVSAEDTIPGDTLLSNIGLGPITGIRGTFGDFWGQLGSDTTNFYPVSSDTIPDTTTDGQLTIQFQLESPITTDSIQSINCILNR